MPGTTRAIIINSSGHQRVSHCTTNLLLCDVFPSNTSSRHFSAVIRGSSELMFPSVRWSRTEWLLVSVSHEALKLFPLAQWVRGLPCDPVRGGGGEGVTGEGRMRGTLNLQTYRRLTVTQSHSQTVRMGMRLVYHNDGVALWVLVSYKPGICHPFQPCPLADGEEMVAWA